MLSNSERLKVAFVGGHTRRWHAADIIGEERVDSHTWGMLALVHILHPSPSVELLGAITFHDSPGEPFSGDIPHGAKVAFPELKAADVGISARVCAALDVDFEGGLSEEGRWWLSFADMAQAYLFAKRQVAQGNALMTLVRDECVDYLQATVDRPGAPEDAVTLVADVLYCEVDRVMSRNLAQLEAKAR